MDINVIDNNKDYSLGPKDENKDNYEEKTITTNNKTKPLGFYTTDNKTSNNEELMKIMAKKVLINDEIILEYIQNFINYKKDKTAIT